MSSSFEPASSVPAAGEPPASAGPVSQPPVPICSVTRKEFLASKISLASKCPGCKHLVIHHAKEDERPPPAEVAPELNAHPRSPHWDYTKVYGLVKEVRWKRNSDTQTSSRFFSQIEVRLTQYSFYKDSEWFKLVPSLMEDPDAGAWVLENIVKADPSLTWDQGVAAFSAHFDTANNQERLRSLYHRCEMKPNETVQQFTTRFMNLVTRLGYDKSSIDEARTIDDLLDRVPLSLKSQWKFWKSTIRSDEHEELERLKKLSFVIQRLITISVSNPELITPAAMAPGLDRKSSKRPHSSKSSGKKAGPGCPIHGPNASHSAAECTLVQSAARSYKKQKSNNASGSGSKLPRRDSSGDRHSSKPSQGNAFTCYTCGAVGHKSPDCPQRSSSQSSQNASSANRSASIGSGKSPFNSQQSSSGAARKHVSFHAAGSKSSAASAASMQIEQGSDESDRLRSSDDE